MERKIMSRAYRFGVLVSFCAPSLLGWIGCTTGPSERADEAPASTAVVSIALTAPTAAALPKCTSALAGTTAQVESPFGLWICFASVWSPIPCTRAQGGLVAFDSTSQVLLACVGGKWTQIALPAGAPGPEGPQGPKGDPGPAGRDGTNGTNGTNGTDGASSLVTTVPEEPGDHCAAGGTKLSFGLDLDGNRELDSAEITNVAYVCNGVSAAEADAGSCGGNGCAPPEPSLCDQDGDGFANAAPRCGTGGPLDCNDTDPTVYPGAPDVCGNGIAENCASDALCPPECQLDTDCPLRNICANATCATPCTSDADCFTSGTLDCVMEIVNGTQTGVCR